MMPAISERTPDWRAALRMDAECLRSLWAAVAMTAVNDAAHELRRARRARDAELAEKAIASFRFWANSRDGREVLALAGYSHDSLVVDRLVDCVMRGDTSPRLKRAKQAEHEYA